jgi:hypothetical protein
METEMTDDLRETLRQIDRLRGALQENEDTGQALRAMLASYYKAARAELDAAIDNQNLGIKENPCPTT